MISQKEIDEYETKLDAQRTELAASQSRECRMRELLTEMRSVAHVLRAVMPADMQAAKPDLLNRFYDAFHAAGDALSASQACPHAADSARIDLLEAEMRSEPLLLHNLAGGEHFSQHLRGLGLLQGQRTLREAIDCMRPAKAAKGGNE
jgi:hypothetical protein